MKKMQLKRNSGVTFEEGCEMYIENCKKRNLREGTIRHCRQGYLYFFKYFDPKMPIEEIDEQTYKDYVMHLKLTNPITVLQERRYFKVKSIVLS